MRNHESVLCNFTKVWAALGVGAAEFGVASAQRAAPAAKNGRTPMKRVLIAMLILFAGALPHGSAATEDVPQFKVDPFWPKPLPDNRILGQVAGIAVGKDDHI
jgi:hypothetical protein